jgi:hypothetical protein
MVSAISHNPASAQVSVSGNGPYYATPSWDQKITTGRFVVLTNWNSEAVLDRETGLVWEKSPSRVQQTWQLARLICAQKTLGERKGWRLPTIEELGSLIDPSVGLPGPTLPAGHPFTNVLSTLYWSASTDADSPVSAFAGFFDVGSVSTTIKSSLLFVWCVRGASHATLY